MTVENILIVIGISGLALFIYQMIAFIVGTAKKDNSIMDTFYGPGYFVVAIVSLIFTYQLEGTLSIRRVFATLLVLIWATRLATYVHIRNKGKGEDPRYAKMREKWKEQGKSVVLRSFGKIYLFQGLVIFLVVFPVLWINVIDPLGIQNLLGFTGITLWLGGIIWLIGFLFETIGDYQLYTFLNEPNRTKKVLDEGLWRYTQHPNYFGEITQWWGIYIIAFGVPFGFLMIFSPIYITWQIINVSGIRLQDKMTEGDDAFARYKRRTSKFFPLPPKKEKEDQ
ncbi:MAG: 3-oxo-5-alpha-steroid 4-dehydrogenase [Promethearchaeota archaeon]|nr:MAG: 3-oxo-5-alpha-steroid 4-dehydrogenase [Candidatus Lokiarchaeota archaeon]